MVRTMGRIARCEATVRLAAKAGFASTAASACAFRPITATILTKSPGGSDADRPPP